VNNPRITKVFSIAFYALFALLLPAISRAEIELWNTTWNSREPNVAQLPPPKAPWRSAWWSTGTINATDSTAQDVRKLAKLCAEGGNAKDFINPKTLAYLTYYNRMDGFRDGVVPRRTLIVADFEGAPDDFSLMLCQNIRRQTRGFVEYPGFLFDPGINYAWIPRMGEVDFYCISRMWMNGNKSALRQQLGDYFLMELYLSDPKLPHCDHDAQFRAWSILLAAARKQLPGTKMLCLVKGGYASPGTEMMSDDERHRVERFALLFDAVWCFGYRNEAAGLLAELPILAGDPLHQFAGEQGWARQ
jgi:hypothetical protein